MQLLCFHRSVKPCLLMCRLFSVTAAHLAKTLKTHKQIPCQILAFRLSDKLQSNQFRQRKTSMSWNHNVSRPGSKHHKAKQIKAAFAVFLHWSYWGARMITNAVKRRVEFGELRWLMHWFYLWKDRSLCRATPFKSSHNSSLFTQKTTAAVRKVGVHEKDET